MLPVPELIKALYAAGLAWLGLAWLGLGISSHNCSVVNQQFSCYCHCHYLQEQGTVKSWFIIRIRRQQHLSWIQRRVKLPVLFLTWRRPHLLEKTNKAMLAWLVTVISVSLLLVRVLDGFWREPPLGSLNQTYHKKGTSIIEWLDMRSVHNDDIETSHTANTNLFVSRPKLKSLHTGIRFKLFTSHRWHWLFSHVIQLWYPYWSFEGSCQVLSCLDLEPDWIMKNESHNQNNEQLAL